MSAKLLSTEPKVTSSDCLSEEKQKIVPFEKKEPENIFGLFVE